jgi:hypothetical protein
MDILAEDFKKIVNDKPDWCKHIVNPVNIIGEADLSKSRISHLSPKITFCGEPFGQENRNEKVADFSDCKFLKRAEGTFLGFVNFCSSRVEKIGDLKVILTKDKDGKPLEEHEKSKELWAASFAMCYQLKNANGYFEGFVNFESSSIEQIDDIIITQASKSSYAGGYEDKKINLMFCSLLETISPKFSVPINEIVCSKEVEGLIVQKRKEVLQKRYETILKKKNPLGSDLDLQF